MYKRRGRCSAPTPHFPAPQRLSECQSNPKLYQYSLKRRAVNPPTPTPSRPARQQGGEASLIAIRHRKGVLLITLNVFKSHISFKVYALYVRNYFYGLRLFEV